MEDSIHVLIVEDLHADAELVMREIRKVLKNPEFSRVWTQEDFIRSLEQFRPDIILSDYYMPGFDGLAALRMAREKIPEVPFIVVTGTLNEDTAVECMRSGAWDYVLKEYIKRLGQAVLNAMEQASTRREKIRAQEALIESEERHRSLFEDNMAMMLLIDPVNEVIIDANPASCSFYGYSREDFRGMEVSEISLSSPADVHASLENAVLQKGTMFNFKHRLKDLSIREVEVHTSTIRVQGKQMLHAIIHDITEKKKMEEELVAAKLKAEENDRLKTAFLHNISHEIRTPLNAIVGFSSFLNNPNISLDKRKEFTDIINFSSEQLLSIITDIINVATLEAGQEKLNLKETDINQALMTVYEQFKVKAAFPNIDLHCETEIPNQDALVLTDGVKLIQILTNLVGNALKYTRRGKVFFNCIIRDDKLRFSIQDSGIGIPKEMHGKIFDRFWQVDSTVTREFGGTGLGLSITKAYVELLNGEIWLESEPGQGSTFFFTLPYQPLKKQTTQDLSRESNLEGADIQKKILIAEDENYNFLLIGELLANSKIELIRAENGLQAVNICRNRNDLDLVLMDIKMPVMDGIEATRQIKRMKPSIPVIALTAYAHDTDKKRLMECGCDDYLSKPLKQNSFFEMIRRYTQDEVQ
jgi:PAS domain S-box-containing protein